MDKKINVNKVIIIVAIIVVLIGIAIGVVCHINTQTIRKQMATAENAVTMEDNVSFYTFKSAKRSKKTLDIGTDAYILERIINKEGTKLCKVKVGKKIGYIKEEKLGTFKEATAKKELMVDVSQFNLQNNFKSIGEFKVFIIKNNIKYVYIRAGGRGYGTAGKFYKDTNYKEYADACEYLKVPFGFYFLDEATNENEVNEEVKFIQDFLNENEYKYNVLPVALDIEKHVEAGRADDIWPIRYILVNQMINKLQEKNINVIVYSNADIANKYLSNVVTELWLAYYPGVSSKPDYWYYDTEQDGAKNFDMTSKMIGWQFSDKGIPNEINKAVDVSIVYSNYFKSGSMEDVENDVKQKLNEQENNN